MALEAVKIEHTSDCEDSDASIELTDEDKNYIEKLMFDRYGFKSHTHKDKFKCVLPCHICDKIELSANPGSTNTFLDFIFMEHENDFEFTKEKRQKIIQSVVNDFIESESKEGKAKSPLKRKAKRKGKTKLVTRKSLLLQNAHRYPAMPIGIRKATTIIHERKRLLYKIYGYSTVSPSFAFRKSKTHASKINKYKKNVDKTKIAKSHPDENKRTKKHTNAQTSKNAECKVECRPRPRSVLQEVESHKEQSDNPKLKPYFILETSETYVTQRNPNSKNINCFKSSCHSVPKRETKPRPPTSFQKSKSLDKENAFLAPQKTQFSMKSGSNSENMQPLMKNPTSPYYIPEGYVDVDLYQKGLAAEGWNPTQVLYEICGHCNWGKPEFLEGGNVYEGFLCCVRIKGFGFMARIRGQTKKIARHLASTRFLNHIGFKFVYHTNTQVPQKNIRPYSGERFAFPRSDLGNPDAPKHQG